MKKRDGVHKHLNVFVKGAVELFVLSELERGPASGKQLMEKMDFVTGSHWHPSPGTIYPTLRRLEEGGVVAPRLVGKSGRRNITYGITGAGKRKLATQRREILECGDVGLEVMLPLRMRVLYGFNDKEIIGLQELLGGALDSPKKPKTRAERKKALKKLVKAWVEIT